MVRKTILYVAIGILTACTSHKEKGSFQSGDFSMKIEDPLNPKEILLSDFVDSISVIILETTDESLMSRASNIICYHDQILISDEMTQKILVFSNTGKFLKSCMKQGPGPDEYARLTNFSVVNDHIYILDMIGRAVLKYDMNFNFINKIRLKIPAMDLIVQKNDDVWIYNLFGQTAGDDFELTKIGKGGLASDFLKRKHPKNFNVNNMTLWTEGNVFHSLHGEIYYSEKYGNQVYKLQDTLPSLYLEFDFGKYTIPPTVSVFCHENIFFSGEFPYVGKDHFFISDKYNMIKFYDSKGRPCYVFQDKETQNVSAGMIKNDIISDFERFIPIFACDNILIEPISVALTHEEEFKGIMRLNPSLSDLSEENNFLLILYHLKK